MKKNLFLILCLALGITALSSCQEEEKSSGIKPERERMFFIPGIDDTRRGITSTSITEIKYFWLVATTYNETEDKRDTLYCGRALHNNGEVTLYNEDYLEEDGTLLWPEDKDQEINIYAIQEPDYTSPDDDDPMEINIGGFTGSIPTYLSITLYPTDETPQETEEQLVAHVITSRSQTSGGVIALNFKHIMTQIQASAKVADDGYFYRISNLSLSGYTHGVYRFSDTSVGQDEWGFINELLDTTCLYIPTIDSNYSEESLRADASEDPFWQYTEDVHYLYYANGDDDYLDIGAYDGEQYVTLMNGEDPLSTFVLPLYYHNNLSIEYSVWTKVTNADGTISAGEKIEDFEYTTTLILQRYTTMNLQLYFDALSIKFAGDNEEGMEPD